MQLEVRLEREAPTRREVAGALRDAERCPEPARGAEPRRIRRSAPRMRARSRAGAGRDAAAALTSRRPPRSRAPSPPRRRRARLRGLPRAARDIARPGRPRAGPGMRAPPARARVVSEARPKADHRQAPRHTAASRWCARGWRAGAAHRRGGRGRGGRGPPAPDAWARRRDDAEALGGVRNRHLRRSARA